MFERTPSTLLQRYSLFVQLRFPYFSHKYTTPVSKHAQHSNTIIRTQGQFLLSTCHKKMVEVDYCEFSRCSGVSRWQQVTAGGSRCQQVSAGVSRCQQVSAGDIAVSTFIIAHVWWIAFTRVGWHFFYINEKTHMFYPGMGIMYWHAQRWETNSGQQAYRSSINAECKYE